MTTAEALESITDSGKFEVLATRVLRIEDEDCRLLEHMGVNAAGKTIPNPIDGFCLVASSDPLRFVMAAYSTEKAESLERKWLFDHTNAPKAKNATAANDGDLIKAARRAELLRKDHPNAKFIVHLCTNRQPDDALMASVYKRARGLGLEVKILAQSRLRDCLDMKAEGQWLRKEHLGIQAELLSLPLLLDLSKKSLQQYEKEFLFTPSEAFISTSSQTALQQSSVWPHTLSVVTGMSGTGKSVACYQVLRGHLSKGYSGLWIPGEVATRASTLAEALEIILRSLHPTIEAGAGATALHLSTPSSQLLLIVDDINRGGNPSETLRKVLAWGRPSTSSQDKHGLLSHSLIVPVWDIFWAPHGPHFKSKDWLVEVPVVQMTVEEAQLCLDASLGAHAHAFGGADLRQILSILSYDPILIAMFAEIATTDPASNQLDLAHQVMECFVRSAEKEAATRGKFLAEEYRTALNHLAIKMLTERRTYPSWATVEQWLPPQDVQALRELDLLKKVCRIIERDGDSHFEFRHDRILEHYLAQVLEPMLKDPDRYHDVLSDPFYASFIGRALAFTDQSNAAVAWIRMHAPLALIAAVRFLNSQNRNAAKIVAAAKEWLDSASKDHHTPPSVLYSAYWLLEETDSEFVLELTKSLSQHRLLARARLANGAAAAGAIMLAHEDWFSPAVNDHGLDAVLSRVLHRHKQSLINDCQQLLVNRNLEEGKKRGVLTLAGFIGDPTLAKPIRVSWESAPNKQAILIPALWAAFRCASEDPATLLNPMMSEWNSLSDESSNGLSDRVGVANELRFAMRRDIPDPILRFLIQIARSNEALNWPITHLLECVDHPLVVRFMVEEAAKVEQRIKGSSEYSPWLMDLRSRWDPTRPTQRRRLKPAAVDVIRSCWESAEAQQQLRETAFTIWVHAIDDISVLQSIEPNHPGFDQVLRRRAKLGDFSTTPLIKPLITADKHWFHVINHIWTEEFLDATDQAILKLQEQTPGDYSGGRTNDHHMLAHLLRDIPVADAGAILEKHWEHLQYSPLFIQAALYLCTPRLQKLAANAVQKYPTSADAFKHIGMFFGFFTYGLIDRLRQQHLDVLLPYIDQLDNSTLSSIAEFCDRHDYRDWAKIHLQPEFEHRRAMLPKTTKDKQERVGSHLFPSDTDLLDDLNWIEQQGQNYSGHLWHWCEGFERRHDDRSRWRRLLEEWLILSPNIERFRLFTEAILEHGSREDLQLLAKHTITGDGEEIIRIVANAKFAVMRRSLR